MAIHLNRQPADFIAAYKPMLCGFVSDLSPVNLSPSTSGLSIAEIRQPNATELSAFPSLLSSDVLVIFTETPGTILLGMMVFIESTDELYYAGNYRVLKKLADGYIVIDAAYVGDDSGGRMARYYERYTMIGEVVFSGLDKPVYVDFKADDTGKFIVDIRDIAQRGFRDLLSDVEMRPGLDWDTIVEAEGLITQAYEIRVWTGYMEPDENGVNHFTEFRKGDEAKILNKVCVNAVQPYHATGISGNVLLDWQQDLVPYLVNYSSFGHGQARFLTYAPESGQTVREDDDVFLAFLWNDTRDQDIQVVVRKYDANGTYLGVSEFTQKPPINSGVLRVGPKNLGSVITDDTASYSVEVTLVEVLFPSTPLTNRYTFAIERGCVEASIRPTALNPLGGADALTMDVREVNGVEVARSTVSKPDMAVDYSDTWTGDYNRRTWAIEMARTYEANSNAQTAAIRKWFGENIFPSPDVRIQIKGGMWTPVVITTRTLNMYTSEQRPAPIRFAFVLGVDNTRQRR